MYSEADINANRILGQIFTSTSHKTSLIRFYIGFYIDWIVNLFCMINIVEM